MSLQEVSCPAGAGLPVGAWMDKINAGVLYLDCDLQVTVYNRLAQELFHPFIPLQQASPLRSHLDSESEAYRTLERLAARRQEVRDLLMVWETEGLLRHVLIDTFLDAGCKNHPPGVWVMTKDLSHFTSLEQQVARSDKLTTLGKIAAGVAHEIRNPLTTVKGFLQVMQQRFEARKMDVELEYIHMMLQEIGRVDTLVAQLLLLSKPHKLQRELCSLPGLIDELDPVIQSESAQRNVTYTRVLEDVPDLLLDPGLIKQLLLNLVKNALEAMEHGGHLKIHVRHAGAWVVTDISDTGPGIPFYQMDKIFDAFFTTKEKGTGLGLPICQRIVGDHGGELRVSSKGYGTTVSVWLPVQPLTADE